MPFGLHHVDAFPIDTHVSSFWTNIIVTALILSATRVWLELSSSICFILNCRFWIDT